MEEQTSNFTTNYVLSQRKDVLNIISGTAFANVKQEKDLYRLLRNSTLNNTDDCLSPKMQARREILLLADRLKPHPKNDSLLIVANFEPSFDKLEEVIEIVVGHACNSKEVKKREEELQLQILNREKLEQIKREKTANKTKKIGRPRKDPLSTNTKNKQKGTSATKKQPVLPYLTTEKSHTTIFKHEDKLLVEYKCASAMVVFCRDIYILSPESTILSDTSSLPTPLIKFREKKIADETLIPLPDKELLYVKKQIQFAEFGELMRCITGEEYTLPYASFDDLPEYYSSEEE